MSTYVIDASVAAKWFVDEEHSQNALAVLDEGNRLHAPDFLLLEMDSIVCKLIRRGVLSHSEAAEIRDALRLYPIQHHPFVSFLDPAFEIAQRTGRSIYDCLYVALAILLGGSMVTADRSLYHALQAGDLAGHLTLIEDVPPAG